jgi:hypothetical protein
MEGKLKTAFAFSILDECHHLCKWLDNKSKHQNTDILGKIDRITSNPTLSKPN